MLLCWRCAPIPCRDSIIPVAGGVISEPDYNNVGPGGFSSSGEERGRMASLAGQEEALYTNPDKVVAALNLEVSVQSRGKSVSVCMLSHGLLYGECVGVYVYVKDQFKTIGPF